MNVSQLQDSRYCRGCRRIVLANVDTPALGVHFILTVFTCGLWLPVFIYVGTFGKTYRCQRCGRLV